MRMNSRFLTECALFSALICILAPLAVPVGVIPVTLGVFAVLFTAVVLDWKRALAAVGIYLMLGLIGMPVFSAGRGGPAVLFGPTGGFLWSYLPMAALVGRMCSGDCEKNAHAAARTCCVCLLALLICYACGTMQFMLLNRVDLIGALASCVVPFVPFDLLKCAAAAVLGMRIRRRLRER